MLFSIPCDITSFARAAFVAHECLADYEDAIAHSLRVANNIAACANTPVPHPALLVASVLHGAYARGEITQQEVMEMFGDEAVAYLEALAPVLLLGQMRDQQVDQVQNARTLSHPAQMFLLAEIAANLEYLDTYDVDGWPESRVDAYLAWAEEVVEQLRDCADEGLHLLVCETLNAFGSEQPQGATAASF